MDSAASPAPSTIADAPPLTVAQKLAYAAPQFSLSVTGALLVPWLTYFYVPPADRGGVPLMSAALFAAVMFGGRIVDAIADPFIGYWSDRCRSKLGRRMPFMLYGTPFLLLSFLGLWFPPFEPGGLANGIYFTVVLTIFWFVFTAVVGPYSALLPEIASSSKARVSTASYMGVVMVIGMIVSAAGIGPLESKYPDGLDVFGYHIDSGIQAFAIFASLSTLLFLVPLINVRETPYSARKDVPPGLFKAVSAAFKNKAFQTFLGVATFTQMGLIMILTSLPYICKQFLERPEGVEGLVAYGQGEAWTGYLMALMVLCALIWIPLINIIVARWGKKKLMVAVGYTFGCVALMLATLPLFSEPAIPMIGIVFMLSAPSAAAIILVGPMYGDVVDFDEASSGVRREGIYTGAMAVLGKASVGLGNSSVVLLLALGASRDEPLGLILVGPIAAASIFLGTWIFSHHPIES